jgi:formylglycine-generating enzyme required for sulfatase activity/tetratricopeptide (TPR) repeat protein
MLISKINIFVVIMPLNKKFISKAFGAAIDSPIVAILAEHGLNKAVSILKQHFCFSAFDIASALQDSYDQALAGIGAGLKADSKLAFVRKLTDSKLCREFSSQIEPYYFQPFAAQVNISNLRQLLLDNLKGLSKSVFEDSNQNPFSEAELAALINHKASDDFTDLILEEVGPLNDTLAAFLRFDGLLGNAVLFFFREKIRQDERVEKSLAALQREGLWADVADIKQAQKQLEDTLKEKLDEHKVLIQQALSNNEFDKIATINQDLAVLNSSLQQVPDILQRAQIAWQDSQQNLLKISQRLEQKVDHIDDNVETLLAEFRQFMQRFDLSSQLKAGDEFTHHTSRSLQLIQAAVAKLKLLPSNKPQYHELIIMAGTVLSSTGETAEAEKLFVEARDLSQKSSEKALASFNLFQIRLWNRDYEQALADLQLAISIDASRYALHDVDRYPPIRLLGAGGMGCVFLCHDQWREHQRVVKCFWEGRKGSRDEVFGEAMKMRRIAGEFVPLPLDCGYADSTRQQHPYFVTEYIEGALDGEAWLSQHGKLNLSTAIAVGLQIAKGLEVAHNEGICHLDLKPANLLFKQENSGLMVKIIDFGLATVATSLRDNVSGATRSGLTQFGQAIVAGTYDYAPPEQLGDNQYGKPSAKSDLFAFAATLYRLMTAESPRHLNPRRLADAPAELFDLLCDCKEENPKRRPETAEVIARLENLLVEKQVIKPGDIFRDRLKDGSEGPEMVLIPAGRFRMGDITGNGDSDELPVHEVSVESFAMGRYPVTFAEYDYFCEATNREKPKDRGWGRDNLPVINVSWHDAVAYTEWLSTQTGQQYRLPTEAEWEYAARAGTETDYWWGNDIDKTKANYDSNSTTPVGYYKPNPFGLYDTAGNVWEWTCSEFTDRYNGKEKDCISKNNNKKRVLRGGSWSNDPRDDRAAARGWDTPGSRDDYGGFRVVQAAAWT